VVGGWDGTSHYAISKVYSENVFPNLFGWIENWYGGMPWPIGYPPLFHFSFAIISRFIPVEGDLLFKLIFIFLTFTLPILYFYIGKSIGIRKELLYISTVLFTLFTVSSYELFRQFGVTIDSTFKSGLYMQLFATSIMFIWIYFFTRENKSNVTWAIVTILQSAVILANLHVGEAMLLFWFGWTLFDFFLNRNLKSVSRNILSIMMSFLLISFWIFPLLETIKFFPGVALEPLGMEDLLSLVIFILFGIIALLIALKKRDTPILRLLFIIFIFTIVSVVPISTYLPWVPLQPARLAVYVIVFSIFIMPYVVSNLQEKYLPGDIAKLVSLALLIFTFFIFAKPTHGRIPEFYISEADLNLAHFLQDQDDGRSLIEAYSPGYPAHYTIAALAGMESHQTLWNVFRESSVSSTFAVPLRNSFSYGSESYGILCYLCTDDWEEFNKSDMETKIIRGRMYGVKYFTAISKSQKEQYMNSDQFDFESSFGDWYVYSLKSEQNIFENSKPVLLYTDFTSRSRDYDGNDSYSWLRYSEEWFLRANTENVFVYPSNNNKQKDQFPLAIVDSIQFLDEVDTKSVILFMNKEELDSDTVEEFRKSNPDTEVVERDKDFKKSYTKLMSKIEGLNEELSYSDKYQYNFTTSSYYPYLQDKDGGDVYMTSPSLSMVVSDKSNYSLQFELSQLAKFGFFVSGSALSLIGFYVLQPYLSVLLTSHKKEGTNKKKD
jgi:hypothetical protein